MSQESPHQGASDSAQKFRMATVSIIATTVRVLGAIFALIMVAYVVLTLGDANPANGITRFVSAWANSLALGFQDLFTPPDTKLRVLVNFGLAALFWLVVSSLLSRLVLRLG